MAWRRLLAALPPRAWKELGPSGRGLNTCGLSGHCLYFSHLVKRVRSCLLQVKNSTEKIEGAMFVLCCSKENCMALPISYRGPGVNINEPVVRHPFLLFLPSLCLAILGHVSLVILYRLCV